MSTPVAHFAINSDDVERDRAFYAGVLGWTFEPYGPPGFYQIATGSTPAFAQVQGAIQQRRELVDGRPATGFECSIAVDDVDAVATAVVANGGRILMERTTLAGVGHLVFFADPSGNAVGAMQYDDAAD